MASESLEEAPQHLSKQASRQAWLGYMYEHVYMNALIVTWNMQCQSQ